MRIFRGIGAPVSGAIVENLIIFWLFGVAERRLLSMNNKSHLSIFEIGLAGSFSGIGTGLWLTPVEYVKCQMQAPNAPGLNWCCYLCLFFCFVCLFL